MQVHSITSAPRPHSDEADSRAKRYLISMGVRTVCFLLVVVIDHPVRWVFAVGAVVLPYVAVVMANAGRDQTRGRAPAVVNYVRPALPAGPSEALHPGPGPGARPAATPPAAPSEATDQADPVDPADPASRESG